MTSWIDGSFVYSNQEAWVSTMRSFKNGTLKWMAEEGEGATASATMMPPYNLARVPLFNEPSPHVLRRLTPERMFGLYRGARVIVPRIIVQIDYSFNF